MSYDVTSRRVFQVEEVDANVGRQTSPQTDQLFRPLGWHQRHVVGYVESEAVDNQTIVTVSGRSYGLDPDVDIVHVTAIEQLVIGIVLETNAATENKPWMLASYTGGSQL